MGKRLQVFVLVVVVGLLCDPAIAAEPISPQDLSELGSRCRHVAGEQAAADLINLLPSLITCTDFERLYAEGSHYLERGDLKGLLETNCRRKEHLLDCAREGLQKLNRCLGRQEKVHFHIKTAEHVLLTTGNFICENIDDISSLSESQELECVKQVGEKLNDCVIQELPTGDEGQLQSHLKLLGSKEQMCQKRENMLQCVNALTGKCKDSTLLRLMNSFNEELMAEITCSIGTVSGATSLLALPGVLGRLAFGLAAPHVLRFQ